MYFDCLILTWQTKLTNNLFFMQSPKKRSESIYDQNGFKTDRFSHQIILELTDHQKVSRQLQRWKQHIIPNIKNLKQSNQRVMINHVRSGVPDALRRQVWPQLILKPIKPYSFYEGKNQCKQIDLDLDRTFPQNKFVKQLTGKMRSVLNAIASALPQLGYCQGMNFISAIILLKLDQEDAFNMLHHIFHWQKHQELLKNLSEIHRKMFILDKLIKKFYPQLHKKLAQSNIDCLFYASSWFITLFCNTLPCAYALRILQIYLMEGEKILYRVALQILKLKKKKLKKLIELENIMQQLKNFQDLITTNEEIDKFIFDMFQINFSRKDIENLDKQYEQMQLKEVQKSPRKSN